MRYKRFALCGELCPSDDCFRPTEALLEGRFFPRSPKKKPLPRIRQRPPTLTTQARLCLPRILDRFWQEMPENLPESLLKNS